MRPPPQVPAGGAIVAGLFQKEVSVDNRKKDDSVAEEASALGQRIKGAAKDAVGDIANDRGLEREGERENAAGRARQASNDIMDETDGVRGATVGESRYSPVCTQRPKPRHVRIRA